jgi:hypothetical protein
VHQVSKILFVTKLSMFRASTMPIIRSYQLYTCFMQVMWLQRPHNLHETYQLPRVQLITPDDGHSRCPKHVEFCDKIHFGYLMHLFCYLYEGAAVSSEELSLNSIWPINFSLLTNEIVNKSYGKV